MSLDRDLNRVERMLRLLFYLLALRFGRTVQELAERFEVGERTIRRDLRTLKINIPRNYQLIRVSGPEGKMRYRIIEILERAPIIGMAGSVVMVRSLAPNILESLIKLPEIQEPEMTYKERITQILNLPKKFARKIFQSPKSASLAKITDAKLSNQACAIKYEDEKKIKKFRILPLEIFNYKNSIYLLAKDFNKKAISILPFSGIRDIEILGHLRFKQRFSAQDYNKLLKNLVKSKEKKKGFNMRRLAKSVFRP